MHQQVRLCRYWSAPIGKVINGKRLNQSLEASCESASSGRYLYARLRWSQRSGGEGPQSWCRQEVIGLAVEFCWHSEKTANWWRKMFKRRDASRKLTRKLGQVVFEPTNSYVDCRDPRLFASGRRSPPPRQSANSRRIPALGRGSTARHRRALATRCTISLIRRRHSSIGKDARHDGHGLVARYLPENGTASSYSSKRDCGSG